MHRGDLAVPGTAAVPAHVGRGSRRQRARLSFIAGLALTLASGAGLTPGGVASVAASWTGSITVLPGGPGSGRVTSDDGGIDCRYTDSRNSGDCDQSYVWPDFQTSIVVTLTYTPDPGSYVCLDGAPGCITSGAPFSQGYEFRPQYSNVLTVLPSFELQDRKVVGNTFGPGTLTADSGTPCTPPDNYEFCMLWKYGERVTVRAVPNAGSIFSYWSGLPCPDQEVPVCEFELKENLNVAATFGRVELTFDVVGSGELCPSGGAACLAGFSMWAAVGSTYAIEARAASGWHFDRWSSGPCAGQDRTCSFTVQQATTAIATFLRNASATPTPKPSSKPTAAPTAAPTAGVTPGPSTSPSPSSTAPVSTSPTATPAVPEPTLDAEASPTPSTGGSPDPSPTSPAAPGIGQASGPEPAYALLIGLGLIAAVAVLVLGYALGRRRTAEPEQAT